MKHFFPKALLFCLSLLIAVFGIVTTEALADGVQIDPSQVDLGQTVHLTILVANATAMHTLAIGDPSGSQTYFSLPIRTDYNQPCKDPSVNGPFVIAKPCQSGVYYIDIDTNKLNYTQSAPSYTYAIVLDSQVQGKVTVTNTGKCATVGSLSIAKASNPEPYTTATNFTIKGQVLNCPNYKGSGMQLRADLPFSKDLQTDGSGNFTADGVVLNKTGTWTLQVWYGGNGPMKPLGGNNSLSITIGSQGKLNCGDPASPNDPNCPASCPAVDTGGKWTCQSTAACKPPDAVLQDIQECSSDTGTIQDAMVCESGTGTGKSVPSRSCDKGTPCYQGEKKIENVKCEVKPSGDCTATGDVKDVCNASLHDLSAATACSGGMQCDSNSSLCKSNTDEPAQQGAPPIQCQSDTIKPTPTPPPPPCAETVSDKATKGCTKIATPLGALSTDPSQFINSLFTILLSLSGGIALFLIIYSGYQLMISQGNPEIIKAARERLTSAFVGLLFLVFALVILQVIGVDILNLPGFAK